MHLVLGLNHIYFHFVLTSFYIGVSTTQTTGVSIFGSSPVQVAAVFPNSPADSVFGGGSAAGAVTPVASSLSTANSWNAAASNRSNSPNDWAWKERNGAGAMSAGSSTGGSAMSGVTSPPVNPFTGLDVNFRFKWSDHQKQLLT